MMIKEAFLTASLVLVVFKSCSSNVSGPQNRSARANGWCQTGPVDFVFLVDASETYNRKYIIQPSLNLVNQFTQQLASYSPSNGNRIGMLCFSYSNNYALYLQPIHSGLYFDCQNTRSGWDRYRYIRPVFDQLAGMHKPQTTIVILLTRGKDNGYNPIPAANTLKHNYGVTIAVVDMINGQGYIQQLQSIATSSAYYFHGLSSDFHLQRLVSAVCHLGPNWPGQGNWPAGGSPGTVSVPRTVPSPNPTEGLKKGTTEGSTGDKLLPLWIVLSLLLVVGIAVVILFFVVMHNRKKEKQEPLKVQVVAQEQKQAARGGRAKKASVSKAGRSLTSEVTDVGDGSTAGQSVAGRQFPNMQQAAKGRASQPKGRGKK